MRKACMQHAYARMAGAVAGATAARRRRRYMYV